MKRRNVNILLLLGVVLLSVVPLITVKTDGAAEIFGGSDDQAEGAITQIRPDYEPWFAPLWEPPSGEIESLLFGLQAALGAGLVFYCVGYWRGRNSARGLAAEPSNPG